MGTKIRNFTPLPDLSFEELVPKDNSVVCAQRVLLYLRL
jgi:hypothetical protein